MRAALFFSALVALFIVAHAVDLHQIFTINVVGSFKQDIPGFECTDCDCTASDNDANGNPGCSGFYDNVPCDVNPDGADDNQQRWGNPSGSGTCQCFADLSPPAACQSGIGFRGVTGISLQANAENSTRIGRMTHYNNVISGFTPHKLQLYINMSSVDLDEDFETIFPLSFIETPNNGAVTLCDPSIQRTNVDCDDRFSFDDYVITKSFVSKNVRYTLQITGFIQPGGSEPIAQFVTEERKASMANVYAKIVTFCEEAECRDNEQFEGAPTCGCVCVLTNKTCNAVFGPLIAVDEDECTCACASDGSQCDPDDPEIGAFNSESCSCGCNLTNAICQTRNELWEVSMIPDLCACVCNRQRFIECRTENLFFFPTGEDCVCTCGVTDDLCKEAFGSNYRANKDKCGCFIPGEDTGLTDGEIAGIVVASVVGPLLIIGFVALVFAILLYLILAGYMPGIYGYKIAQASFGAGGNSGLYADPWQSASNAASG